jgi:hypothetical protein
MSRPPIGEIMVELKLLTAPQVEEVLELMRDRRRGRFGELAIELGYLDEGGLSASVARQYGLGVMSPHQVERLGVPSEVLELLPRDFLRERLVVPTFFDTGASTLSLIVADPTDLPTQRLARDYARAKDLRLFVSTRSAIGRLLDRLLSETGYESSLQATHPGPDTPTLASREVIFEPDLVRSGVLRRLVALEERRAEVVGDPDQVTSLLEAGAAHAVVFRAALTSQVEPFVGVWRRARPGLRVTPLPALTPGSGERSSDGGLLPLIRRLSVEGLEPERAAAVRRGERLARRLGLDMDLAPDHLVDVSLAALLSHRGPESELLSERPFARALLAALETRLAGAEPQRDLAVEVLFAALDPELPEDRLHPDLVRSRDQAVRSEVLRARLTQEDEVDGSLRDLSLRELLEALVEAGRSVQVVLTGAAERGFVDLVEGELYAARWGSRRGETALRGLDALRSGSFEVRPAEDGVERDLHGDTAALLAELG